MTNKTLTVNKATEENLVFGLEIMEVGAAYHGTFVVTGQEYHGVGYQAKSEEEILSDFEYFKSGFLKLQALLEEGIQKNVPRERCITLKEARIMSGIHPAILAERLGISLDYLKRMEEGEAKQGFTWSQAYTHYQSTYVKGSKMDFIEWGTKEQKKPLTSGRK